mgnify:FL=1
MRNLVKDPCFVLGLWKPVSEPEGFGFSSDRIQTPPEMEASLKIENRGWEEWRLIYNGSFPVKPRETYRLTVRMMLDLEDRKASVILEPRILDKKGERLRAIKEKWMGDSGEPFIRRDLGFWRGGIIAAAGKWDWRCMTGGFMIPDGAVQMNLLLHGTGPGRAWISGVELHGDFYRLVRAVKPPQVPDYPKAVLYKRLVLGEYAGKVLRLGDLNGDGKVEFLFAQRISPNPAKPSNVKYVALKCLTAVNLDGEVLWQKGEPDISGYDVWSDLPVQVFDFNGDGKSEVLCCMDFKIMLLDGSTGEILAETDTPKSNPGEGWGEGAEDGFPRILGDSITICNLTGHNPGDFLLKDRYNNIWAYDGELNELWSYTGKTAHYAQVYDVDGDGFDEVFSGDALIDEDGEVLWRIDLYGHCDSSVFYRDRRGRLILAVGYEDGGFYFLDALTGEILKEWHLGHGQGVNLASYRHDQPDNLAIAANTFWGGAFWFIFSLNGNLLHADFRDVYGRGSR